MQSDSITDHTRFN